MAASGKKRTKWKPVEGFLDTRIRSWADQVDDEEVSNELSVEKYDLPTAPKASRGTTIDESKIPLTAPFQAFISNAPYDLNENELITFFQNLKVKKVTLPRAEKGGIKAKGHAYIEFEDRASLISALSLGENTLKGRPLRIDLPTTNFDNSNRGGRGGRGNRDGGRSDMGGGSDRTAGNWRSGPRADDFEERGGGGSGFDRGGYGNRRDFGGGGGGGFSRGFEERGFFKDDRGGGGGMDRDRYNRDDRMRNDHRGGGFSQGGGGGGGGFDRGGGGGGIGRDRDDRGFSSFSERDRGFSRRDDDRGGRDDRGSSGLWREDSNYNRMEDRRDRSDRYGGGRRDDLPPVDRGGGEARTRPKLKLQPRTKPPTVNESETPATNSSIFGGARPVDTAAREREIEERLRRGEDLPDLRSKSGPSSTGGGSQKDLQIEKRTEPAPAPPPKDNPWTRKATSAAVVNNGRSSPEEVRQTGSGHISDDDKNEPTRSSNRGADNVRRQEPKKIEENRSRGPQHKGGTAGGNISSEKTRVKEEKQPSKHRDGRKDVVDDISRMPKVQESKVPNFAGSNKFSTLDSDETPLE